MNAQNYYDLAPVGQLLVGAMALCALVLGVWWSRHATSSAVRRRQALTVVALFLTFDLILVGAFTRLTDSGLGCPDWPGCYGSATPLGASAHIENAQAAMPSGPVTHHKAWIEMLHRYLAMAVGALIMVLTGWAWFDRARQLRAAAVNPWWPTLTLIWICLQGAFGALTVTMQLFPFIVSAHLLGAYVLLALLVLQVCQFHHSDPAPSRAGARVLAVLFLGLGVVLLQAMLGAWVSTNYAVLACNEIPRCQGQWWPVMDFSSAFEWWRPLGSTASGEVLSFPALTAIHMTHRLFAVVTTVVLVGLLVALRTVEHLHQPLRWLSMALALQLITGLSNVVLDWPLLAAMLHTGGAGALIATLTWMLVISLRNRGRSDAFSLWRSA